MTKIAKNNNTKVIITGARLSYCNLFTPKSINGSDAKYSVSILIDKNDKDSVEVIKTAINNAAKESASKWNGKIPANLKTPLRDGDVDRADDEVYQGKYFINANSKRAPQVVGTTRDFDGRPTQLTEEEVYSGCFGNVSVNFYGFNVNGNRGIACGLNNVQKTKDGERLGGASNASDDFEFDEADDDFLI